MKFDNLKSNLFYGILIVAFLYLISCGKNNNSELDYNKKFAIQLQKKLDNIAELDELEKYKIQTEINKLLNEKSKIRKVAKSSITSAIRGSLAGGLVGGIEGAIAGGIVFGCISPVISMIDGII